MDGGVNMNAMFGMMPGNRMGGLGMGGLGGMGGMGIGGMGVGMGMGIPVGCM